MITCQFLYDLRTLTGFISGSELHELFRKLVGTPSPTVRLPVDLARAEQLCPRLTAELDDKRWRDDTIERMKPVSIRDKGERAAEWLRELIEEAEACRQEGSCSWPKSN